MERGIKMTEFYEDYQEWLNLFNIYSEGESSDEEDYDIYGESSDNPPEPLFSLYGYIETSRASLTEISDRHSKETFRLFICDTEDTDENTIELKENYRIAKDGTEEQYKIVSINKYLDHHFECEVQRIEVS